MDFITNAEFANDYDDDHMKNLLEWESRRINFVFRSPQVKYRTKLVSWLKKIAVAFKLEDCTIHLGVYLLDVFMDNFNIRQSHLHLIALVSLIIATKFEEQDSDIITVETLSAIVNIKYSLVDFHRQEKCMLSFLQWNLMYPTAVHFANYYKKYLLSKEELNDIESIWKQDFLNNVNLIIRSYLDYVLDDITLMQTKPSKVAAGIMALTRKKLSLKRTWPIQLKQITNFKLIDLKLIIMRLKKVVMLTVLSQRRKALLRANVNLNKEEEMTYMQ